MNSPDYSTIQQLLAQERSLADAAEAHGTLAGCLCAAAGYRFEDWLHEILPEGRARSAAAASLNELYATTAEALRQPDMEFQLVLPESGCSSSLKSWPGRASSCRPRHRCTEGFRAW